MSAWGMGFLLDELIDRVLREDLASGDLTTEACVEDSAQATAHAVARHPMVACGGPVFARVFQRLDPSLCTESHMEEGSSVQAGASLWTVRGAARSILMGERVALNLVQRLAGIATTTRAYVEAVPPGCATRIADTRKTTPGLRGLERYAVRIGGGHNHRDHLGAAVLIKDNHLVASGGIAAAVSRSRAYAPHTTRIACEIDRLDQLDEALEAGVDIVLLDNMSAALVAEAVERVQGRALVEVSGGIKQEHVASLSRAGADVLSVGALTHSAPAADIGLDFVIAPFLC